jgi:hypothetical protein
VEGVVDGSIDGDHFQINIRWPEGLVGVYSAAIGPDGTLKGRTYDKHERAIRQTWYSSRSIVCRPAQPAAPAQPVLAPRSGKPVGRTSGRPQGSTQPEPANAAPQPAAGAPWISAKPILVRVPAGESQGTTTVTWDGGPDHPYAELWVKEGDEDEKFVVEQGKGSRSFNVNLGTTYVFILTDNAKRLRTVTIRTAR